MFDPFMLINYYDFLPSIKEKVKLLTLSNNPKKNKTQEYSTFA